MQAQLNITLSELKFGSCMCLAASAQCLNCHPSSQVIWPACGFGLPLGVDWRWRFLESISNRFWTKTTWGFPWFILLPQDNKDIAIQHSLFQDMEKSFFCPSPY